MARNKTVTLTALDRLRSVSAEAVILSKGEGANVTMDYTKRDGTAKTLTGRVKGFRGTESTRAVVLLTDKGYRSANLYNVKNVR